MIKIRFHGRGGQGIKTASHVLGSSFFLAGFEVQDAPRYGAERRGAPIFAYVRAAKKPIYDRGIINRPDLVIVVDDTLLLSTAAAILNDLKTSSVILINSDKKEGYWRSKLGVSNRIVLLPTLARLDSDAVEGTNDRMSPESGTLCAAAAARLVGVIDRSMLQRALKDELSNLTPAALAVVEQKSLAIFDALSQQAGTVIASSDTAPLCEEKPAAPTPTSVHNWIELAFEEAHLAAPSIYQPQTSRLAKTGLWRTLRPVIDYDKCHQCYWICSSYCPDSAIDVDLHKNPVINYEQCKGCMICVAQCPPKAIFTVNETIADETEAL